jgi:hypothetical protein
MHDVFKNADTSGTPSVILMSELNIVSFKTVCYVDKNFKIKYKILIFVAICKGENNEKYAFIPPQFDMRNEHFFFNYNILK